MKVVIKKNNNNSYTTYTVEGNLYFCLDSI